VHVIYEVIHDVNKVLTSHNMKHAHILKLQNMKLCDGGVAMYFMLRAQAGDVKANPIE
jgi:hypothetical protein